MSNVNQVENQVEVQKVIELPTEKIKDFGSEVLVFAEAKNGAETALKTAWQAQLKLAQLWMSMDIELETLKASQVADPRKGKKGKISIAKLYEQEIGYQLDKGNISKAVTTLKELAPTGNEKAQEKVIEIAAISGRDDMYKAATGLKKAKKADLEGTPTPAKVLTALKSSKDPQIPEVVPPTPDPKSTKPQKRTVLVSSEDVEQFDKLFDGANDDIAVAAQMLKDAEVASGKAEPVADEWQAVIDAAKAKELTPEEVLEVVNGDWDEVEEPDEIPATLDDAIAKSEAEDDDEGGF